MFKLKFLLIIVAMIDDSHSYSTVRGDNQTNWYDVRYPYKAVYGLPNKLKCKQSIYERFDECEKTSHLDWQITIDEYFYETKKFCCFIWDTLDCEVVVAKQCFYDYSIELELNARETYLTSCNHIGYGHGNWKCWWTERRIITVSSVVGGVLALLTIVCIGFGLYKYYKSKNKVIEEIPFKNIKEIGSPTDFRHHYHAGMNKAPNAERNVSSMEELKQALHTPVVQTSITPTTPTPTPATTPPMTPTDHVSILASDTQTMDQIQNLDKLL
ncbi:uncharacterized protein LOC142645826 isoform X3 [Dermatophagoides pteronyssinus]|uniref:uncharacterized protein LOC142645826 isoform X3 n=1 Tax=Dermatophagoides pteronyssinus TaxID=6956 RepID=UPI003F66C79A